MIYARIAAVTYVAWGILHLGAAYGVYQLGTTLDAGALQGRIYQGAWNLTFFALFGAVVGIVFIWRNNRLGYWLNAVVVSAGDIGFIVTLLIPGTVPLVPGALGPVLWIIALALSTIALKSAPHSQHQPTYGPFNEPQNTIENVAGRIARNHPWTTSRSTGNGQTNTGKL